MCLCVYAYVSLSLSNKNPSTVFKGDGDLDVQISDYPKVIRFVTRTLYDPFIICKQLNYRIDY